MPKHVADDARDPLARLQGGRQFVGRTHQHAVLDCVVLQLPVAPLEWHLEEFLSRFARKVDLATQSIDDPAQIDWRGCAPRYGHVSTAKTQTLQPRRVIDGRERCVGLVLAATKLPADKHLEI